MEERRGIGFSPAFHWSLLIEGVARGVRLSQLRCVLWAQRQDGQGCGAYISTGYTACSLIDYYRVFIVVAKDQFQGNARKQRY